MNDRIKELRIKLNMTQPEFGERLGVAFSTVSGWEIRGKVKNSSVLSICKTFNVNENWLRYGKGEMFNKPVPPRNRTDQEIAEEYLLNALDCLTPEYQEYFKNVCQKFLEKQNKKSE